MPNGRNRYAIQSNERNTKTEQCLEAVRAHTQREQHAANVFVRESYDLHILLPGNGETSFAYSHKNRSETQFYFARQREQNDASNVRFVRYELVFFSQSRFYTMRTSLAHTHTLRLTSDRVTPSPSATPFFICVRLCTWISLANQWRCDAMWL